MTQTTLPPVARSEHDVAPVRTEGREVVAAICKCKAAWSANDSQLSFAEWAFHHTAPTTVAAVSSYEEQRHAYDVACGLRQLADQIVRNPELSRLFEYVSPQIAARDVTDYTRLADMLGADPVGVPVYQGKHTERRRYFGPVETAITIDTAALAAEPF